MSARIEGTLAMIAALIVLFSAMWDPRISVIVSIVALAAFGISRFLQKNRQT